MVVAVVRALVERACLTHQLADAGKRLLRKIARLLRISSYINECFGEISGASAVSWKYLPEIYGESISVSMSVVSKVVVLPDMLAGTSAPPPCHPAGSVMDGVTLIFA